MTLEQKEKMRIFYHQQQMQYAAYMQYMSMYGHPPPGSYGYPGYPPNMDMSL